MSVVIWICLSIAGALLIVGIVLCLLPPSAIRKSARSGFIKSLTYAQQTELKAYEMIGGSWLGYRQIVKNQTGGAEIVDVFRVNELQKNASRTKPFI